MAQRAIWIALTTAAGAGCSLFLACVTPFAALATFAGLKMQRRDAALTVGLVWLVNQAAGYGILGYPRTLNSLAWGVAIGISSYFALGAAMVLSSTRPVRLAVSLPFVGAFAAYELGLYLAGWVLGGAEGAFSAAILERVFLVNLAALVGLLAIHQVASLAAWSSRPGMPPRLAA